MPTWNKTTRVVGSPCCNTHFVSAWAPNADDTNSFYSRVIPGKGPGHHQATRRRWLTSLPASRPK